MMPILCSINENLDVETRKISFGNRLMPNKIGNHPSSSSVKL
jgi:hypothetical protein